MKNINKQISLKFNIFLNMMYEILLIIAPLITAPYISRVLQPEGVGINSYVSSLLTYFTLFATLGTASYGKRIIAGARDNTKEYSKAFWEIELITVFTTGICLLLWIILSLLYTNYTPYMLVLSFTLISSLFDISWLYGGLEKFQYTVSVNSICKIISIFCIFIFVKNKNDVLLYTTITSLSTFIGTATMWIFLPKEVVKANIEFNSIKKHLKGTLIYFVPAIATSIYTVLDKTLIGIITNSDSENGYYEQATKVLNVIKAVCFGAINGVMMARASFLFSQNDKNKLIELRNSAFQLTSFLSVGACFGIIGTAHSFVPIFFGDGYSPVITLLYILASVIIIICISSALNDIYYKAGGKMKEATKFVLVGATLNFVLNIILINKLGAYGAAIATIIAESVVTILFVNGTNGFIKWSDIYYFFIKKIIAGILMLCVIFILNKIFSTISNYFLIMLDILCGICVYCISLIILKDTSVSIVMNYLTKKILKRKGEFIDE